MFSVTGRLSDKSFKKTGVSEKGAWKAITFLIEKTRKGKPIKIPITARGKWADLIETIPVREKITVHFYIDGVKGNDRYYTNCVATEIEKFVPKKKFQFGVPSVGDDVYDISKDNTLGKEIDLFNAQGQA